jgi:type II secretory pathway pseudopilin PulG
MKRRTNGERGMSLVEVTIILMVLAILTAVAAPSINDYVQDARDVKAKEDVEAIGVSIARLVRDTGKPGLMKAAATAFTKANRVDLLVSEGNIPAVVALDTPDYPATNVNLTFNWGEAASFGDTMLNQFVVNAPAYSSPTAASMLQPSPAAGIGWRGAYLGRSIGPDPWGNRYAANTAFLGPATDAEASGADGYSGWTKDVIVLSAGRNGTVNTSIGGSANNGTAVEANSDDVFYVVSGSSR